MCRMWKNVAKTEKCWTSLGSKRLTTAWKVRPLPAHDVEWNFALKVAIGSAVARSPSIKVYKCRPLGAEQSSRLFDRSFRYDYYQCDWPFHKEPSVAYCKLECIWTMFFFRFKLVFQSGPIFHFAFVATQKTLKHGHLCFHTATKQWPWKALS